MEFDIKGYINSDCACFHVLLSPREIAILDANPYLDGFYLSRVNVPKNYRGLGVGSALMQKFKAAARKAGIKHVIVEPGGYQSADQNRRVRWYEKHGFIKQEEGHYLLDLTQTQKETEK